MGRWIVAAGTLLVGGWAIVRVAQTSGDPGHYYEFRNAPPDFAMPYPTQDVLAWSAPAVISLLIASAIVLRAKSLARACAWLAASFAGLAFIAIPFAGMHAPPYTGLPLFTWVFACGWFAIAALGSRAAASASTSDR
jgi:hypothetical protein